MPFDIVKPTNYAKIADLTGIKAELLKLHQQRMTNSVDYKVLMSDIADNKKRDGETNITLNETKLKSERDALEAKSLARLNELRASRGLPAVKKGDKMTKEDAFDFMEDESLKVMIDYMKFTKPSDNKLTKVMPAIDK
ncbi:Tail-specific protease [compost metagenome]